MTAFLNVSMVWTINWSKSKRKITLCQMFPCSSFSLVRFRPFLERWSDKTSSTYIWECTNLAELHPQVGWIAPTVEQRLFKSFNNPSFNVVVRSRWKLDVNKRLLINNRCASETLRITGFVFDEMCSALNWTLRRSNSSCCITVLEWCK